MSMGISTGISMGSLFSMGSSPKEMTSSPKEMTSSPKEMTSSPKEMTTRPVDVVYAESTVERFDDALQR